MVGAGGVDVVDHGGQRGGLAAAGGAGDQDQPAGFIGQFFQHFGQAKLVQGGDLIVEQAQRGRRPALLVKHVDTLPQAVRRGQRKITVGPAVKDTALGVV